MGAGLTRDIARRRLLGWRERGLAGETKFGRRFTELAIDGYAMVEHKTLALPVIAAALFEVAEDPAVELIHVSKAFLLQQRRRLLATDAASAISNDWRCAGGVRKLFDCFGKRAK